MARLNSSEELEKFRQALLSQRDPNTPCISICAGAGRLASGASEVISAFEKVSGVKVPYTIVPRRKGDLPEFYANPNLALTELGWHTELDLEQMVADTWRWQSQNPNGY